MARPWKRVLVESDPDYAQLLDGRLVEGLRVAMSDEDVEAMRQGYKCINCWENLDNAFPKECPLCSFPMKTDQAEHFSRIYIGHVPGLRTGADWEAEADRLEERAERRAFEKRARESGIVVPKLVR